MEHWHTNTSAPYQSKAGTIHPSSRVLASSSGNIQQFSLDSKEGLENRNPFGVPGPSSQQLPPPDNQYPIPQIKLRSNDHCISGSSSNLQSQRLSIHGQDHDNIQRLERRRAKDGRNRRLDLSRPYLQRAEYVNYRNRQRCDTGPDGKPVWDDHVEDAFQEALSRIEPMGRRKKSQRGKPCGRNELISIYIQHKTGEYRTRKQVSSHIQVLKNLLNGIPEWDALMKPPATERGTPKHQYYADSIEHMAKGQITPMSRNYYGTMLDHSQAQPDSYGFQSQSITERHKLQQLSFEMWVGLRNKMDQASHIYTRLQSSSSTSAPMPLEDLKNWRTSFPGLRSIVESWYTTEHCNIMLLEASFQLMEEFPPKFSKLGISLELDFLNSSGNAESGTSGLSNWVCTVQIYQHSRLVQEVHNKCEVVGNGKVKPFFESTWWASTFMQLMEKRKAAEESKSDGALNAVNEHLRNFFAGLTVMQTIVAEPMKNISPGDAWQDKSSRGKRMAILLWKFSQAPAGSVGITTWQRLVPPPDRLAANSPPPLAEMGLPPLNIDTMMDTTADDEFFSNHDMLDTQHSYDVFHQPMDICNDHLSDYKSETLPNFESLHASHGSFDYAAGALGSDLDFSLDMPTHTQGLPNEHHSHLAAEIFEVVHTKAEPANGQSDIYGVRSFDDDESPILHQPLAKFDMNTHRMLQTKLEDQADGLQESQQTQLSSLTTSDEQSTQLSSQPINSQHSSVPTRNAEHDDEAIHSVLLAASAMHDLNLVNSFESQTQSQTYQSSSQQPHPPYVPSSHPFASPTTTTFTQPSTLTVRPPLQAHHSFAGTTNNTHYQQHEPPHLHMRRPSRSNPHLFSNASAFSANADFFALHDHDFDTVTSSMLDPSIMGFESGLVIANRTEAINGAAVDGLTEHHHHYPRSAISRPRSQPVLPARTLSMGDHSNVLGLRLELEDMASQSVEKAVGSGDTQRQQQRNQAPGEAERTDNGNASLNGHTKAAASAGSVAEGSAAKMGQDSDHQHDSGEEQGMSEEQSGALGGGGYTEASTVVENANGHEDSIAATSRDQGLGIELTREVSEGAWVIV